MFFFVFRFPGSKVAVSLSLPPLSRIMRLFTLPLSKVTVMKPFRFVPWWHDRERLCCAKKGVVCRSPPSLSGSNRATMFRGTRRLSTSPDFSLTDVRTLSWKKLGWVTSYCGAVFLRFADRASVCLWITDRVVKDRMGLVSPYPTLHMNGPSALGTAFCAELSVAHATLTRSVCTVRLSASSRRISRICAFVKPHPRKCLFREL